jgi:Mn2+/Fe2+ NRAMP family transporter
MDPGNWSTDIAVIYGYKIYIYIYIYIYSGYMDPGNWSTDIAGGSAYGYDLLFVVLASSLIAMFLQCLAVRQGTN